MKRNQSNRIVTRIGITLFLLFVIAAAAPALAVKEYYPFTRIGIGSRPLGMGNAFVATANDASTTYWNPAGCVQMQQPEFMAMHVSNYNVESYFDVFATVQPLQKYGAAGFTYLGLRSENIPITKNLDTNGNPVIEKYAADEKHLLMLSYAYPFSREFSAGFNVKHIFETVYGYRAEGWGCDIGLWGQPSPAVSLGLNIMDVSNTLIAWKDGHGDTIPVMTKAGITAEVLKERLFFALDADFLVHFPTTWHFGCEYWVNPLTAVRFGLDDEELTAGIGLRYKRWGMDYAYKNSKLEELHWISFNIALSRPRIERTSEADRLLDRYSKLQKRFEQLVAEKAGEKRRIPEPARKFPVTLEKMEPPPRPAFLAPAKETPPKETQLLSRVKPIEKERPPLQEIVAKPVLPLNIKPLPSKSRQVSNISVPVPKMRFQEIEEQAARLHRKNVEKAKKDLDYLVDCVKTYNYLESSPAQDLKDLVGKCYPRLLVDPWGKWYRLDPEQGIVVSAGRDGKFNTIDDLFKSYWQ